MMKYGRLRAASTKAAVVVGGVTAIGMSLFAFTASPASAASRQTTGYAWAHCPWEYVCVYPQNKNPFASTNVYPESKGKYYTYGAHQLHNQYGWHYILDNQSGDDHGDLELSTCAGGGHVYGAHDSGGYGKVDLTPVNCILLD